MVQYMYIHNNTIIMNHYHGLVMSFVQCHVSTLWPGAIKKNTAQAIL